MKENNVRIAVLLCTHNGEAHIESQLRSLAEQSWPPFVLFIHDWGSTDATLQKIRQFAAICGSAFKVTVHSHAEAPGAKASFVHAIGDCLESGIAFDYLMFCDQDDIWSVAKLATYAEAARRNDGVVPEILYSDVRIVASNGQVIADSFYGGATAFARPSSLRDAGLLLSNPVIGMTLCVSRDLLRRVAHRLHGPWLMHEWAIVLLAVGHGVKVHYVPAPLVDYRQHEGNLLGAATGVRLWARLGKARRHFAQVQAQIALIATMNLNGWPPAALPILRGGPLQRFFAAAAAFRSILLRGPSRIFLGFGILLLW